MAKFFGPSRFLFSENETPKLKKDCKFENTAQIVLERKISIVSLTCALHPLLPKCSKKPTTNRKSTTSDFDSHKRGNFDLESTHLTKKLFLERYSRSLEKLKKRFPRYSDRKNPV
jgi:hypothetical protein